jgi:predicted GH43/DUF377 family glycosyl hydrolase
MKLQRYTHNPILKPDTGRKWESGAVFNCGATLSEDDRVYLLYRAVSAGYTRKLDGGGYDNYVSSLGCAVSQDGINFVRFEQPVIQPTDEWERYGCEDPRITMLEMEGRPLYLITYTALSAPAFSGRGDRVAFPELIQGKIAMLHRVAPNIQIVYFDDLEQLTNPGKSFWREYTAVLEEFTIMKPKYQWESSKIGAGPPPVKTKEGWLLIYHGVDENHIYRTGIALLDLEDPSKVIARSPYPILEPEAEYERVGDVPNVVFPEGAVIRDGMLYVYYGGADKCCCLATADSDDFLDHLLAFRV